MAPHEHEAKKNHILSGKNLIHRELIEHLVFGSYICQAWYFFIFHKKQNKIFCYSMVEPGEHAKWNKPVSERQIPYDVTDMWNLMNKTK